VAFAGEIVEYDLRHGERGNGERSVARSKKRKVFTNY